MPHHHHLTHAITIASQALGTTAPNPTVGCVIVKNGKIIATAHTGKGGRPHAETIALAQAGNQAKGATAYVTLEPCSHEGQTSACAESLIKADIKQVVIGATDPFYKVNGSGIRMLQDAGIEVITGICEEEANRLHEGFFSVQQKNRPFVTLKIASSMDGKIALKDGSSKWITNEDSRAYVHLLRAKHDAIITGIATVMADDPLLTCRLPGMENRSPIRVVLDTNLSLPPESNLVKTAKDTPVWVITLGDTIKAQPDKAEILEKHGVKLLTVRKARNGKICMEHTMEILARNSITLAMIEAGSAINTAALHYNLVDRIIWFKAPILIGNDGIPAIKDLNLEELTTRFKMDSYKYFSSDCMNILSITSDKSNK